MKRCLLICPIGLGNYYLAYPAFHLLKKHFPDTAFFLVVLRRSILAFAQNDPLFTEVISGDPGDYKSISSKLSFIRRVRKLACDTAISFFPSNRLEYNLLMFLSGAGSRYAFNYGKKKWRTARFLSNRTVPVGEALHDVDQNLQVPSVSGCPKGTEIEFPKLYNEEDEAAAGKWLEKQGLNIGNLIGIHPGCSAEHGMVHKRWPQENFSRLAEKLIWKYQATVLIFGGPEESLMKQKIAAQTDVFSVEGLSLRETAALISRCRFFISNDSGLMHIAALNNVPVAGIFGPTDDRRTAPWGDRHLIIRCGLDCSPCWKIANVGIRTACRYGDYRCLRQLSVEEVYKRIEEWQKK